ncbi:MAG: LON peptidase substrate-binding domain-containing protein [Blastocatellia bacterium]|nr:LON peptidase substrate-binding domain-containing protein [Blastocatellia bacterium]
MSEASEKVEGMKQLAIFPLPLVLLPNELLPLHIFEPRYRQMFQAIEHERKLFGLSYFDPKESFAERPATGTVGCVAEVRETQTMPDGRSNVLTAGVIRYRVLDYVDLGEPYLTAEVEFFEDIRDDEKVLKPAADEIFRLFERVARAAFDLSGSRGKFPEIKQSDPEQLSFLVTAAFGLDNELKYELLAMESTILRLNRLRGILSHAVEKMEESAEIHKGARTNGHSDKKIEL